MTFPINLIGELVAVRLAPVEGTIRLPDWKRVLTGKIVAAGPGCSEVLLGLRASFGAAVGMDAQISGYPIRILKEQDLDFIYEDEGTTRVVEQYNINDDPLPCRCTVNQPCTFHMLNYEA